MTFFYKYYSQCMSEGRLLLFVPNLLVRLANTHEPLGCHGDRGVHRVGEADLGDGEDEGDEVWEDV